MSSSPSSSAASEPTRQSKRRRVAARSSSPASSPESDNVPYRQRTKTTTVVSQSGRVVTLPNQDYNGKPKGCCVCDAETREPIQVFASLSEAERVLQINRMSIGRACREGGDIVSGLYFRNATQEDMESLIHRKPEHNKRAEAQDVSATSSEEEQKEVAQPKERKRRQTKTATETKGSTSTSSASTKKKLSPPEHEYKGRPRAVKVSDVKTGEVIGIFPSFSLAERITGISRKTIGAACRQSGVHKGYRFCLVSREEIPASAEYDSTGRQMRICKKPLSQSPDEGQGSKPKQAKDSGSNSKSSGSDGIAHRRPRRAASKPISTGSEDDSSDEDSAPEEEDSPPHSAPSNKKRPKKKPIEPPRPLPPHMYGLPLVKKRTHDECAGCHGARNEQAETEAIVLCDGEGCDREYHLGCTHLSEVPEGSFYCEDCDAYGTTIQLRQYFESSAQERAHFDTSQAYVASLLEKQLGYMDNDEIKDEAATKLRVPMSELWRLSESHSVAMSNVKAIPSKSDKGSAVQEPQKPCPPLGPEFLVGKPLRMYCPVGNNYHDGKILDWRKATHMAPVSGSEDRPNAFHGNSSVASSEFLVRFPAGVNHRKHSLHCWMILEEHSLAVGVSLVWGKFDLKGGSRGWKPAQTWLRTSLELVPVCHLLDESKNQVSYATEYRPGGETWALTKLLGNETHILLNLETEAVDFFAAEFSRGSKGQQGKGSLPPSPRKGHDTQNDRQMEIATALAFTESQEQQKTREWYSMPLNSGGHRQALSIVDESALPPLTIATEEVHIEESQDDRIPRLCPLIEQGLDRLWIMKLTQERGMERSLDTASSLSCQLVECAPAAVAQAREEKMM